MKKQKSIDLLLIKDTAMMDVMSSGEEEEARAAILKVGHRDLLESQLVFQVTVVGSPGGKEG